MTRSDIKALITYKMRYYTKGKRYEAWVNGDYMSYARAKKVAEVGDQIRIEVIRSFNGWEEIGDINTFNIEEPHASDPFWTWLDQQRSAKQIYSTPPDYQRKVLYRWEHTVPGYSSRDIETVEEAQRLTDEIHDYMGFDESPYVTYNAQRKRTCAYFPHQNEIRIATWGFSSGVIIHECAHSIIAKMGIEHAVSAHGPLFVSVFAHLLAQFLFDDEDGVFNEMLIESARDHGLKAIDGVDPAFIQTWKQDKLWDIADYNLLRQTRYFSMSREELNDTQVEVLHKLASGSQDVDGRTVRALINRKLATKQNGCYALTEQGEVAAASIQ